MNISFSKRGFTLLELLISIALLGIIFAFLTGALNFTHRAWKTSNEVSQRAPVSVVRQFLDKHIAAAIPARKRGTGNNVQIVFKGEDQRLEFITELQERGVKAGLYKLAFFLEGQDFKVSIFPYHPNKPSVVALQTRILLRRVSTLKFEYFEKKNNTKIPTWKSNWPYKDNLPQLIKIEFGRGKSEKTESLVIELKLSERI